MPNPRLNLVEVLRMIDLRVTRQPDTPSKPKTKLTAKKSRPDDTVISCPT